MLKKQGARATIAILPARAGSKRIPRKNICAFLGVPILARTVGLLIEVGIFDRIIVSTDDDEIADIGSTAGAEAPFRRPPDLANDAADTRSVIAHAIKEIQAQGPRPEFVCCVYPTAVLAIAKDVRKGYELLASNDVDYVFTGTSFPYPVQRAIRKTIEGRCEMLWPEYGDSRSQDLEPAFHDAGQFYFGRREAWLSGATVFGPRSMMLEVPRHRVQDIDTPEDWRIAEMIFQRLQAERDGE